MRNLLASFTRLYLGSLKADEVKNLFNMDKKYIIPNKRFVENPHNGE